MPMLKQFSHEICAAIRAWQGKTYRKNNRKPSRAYPPID